MSGAAIRSITLYPLAIPLRQKVSHAASERVVADPVVASVELYDDTIGYGETLARPYVTSETVESVLASIEEVFVPVMMQVNPASFPHALEAIEALPWTDGRGQSLAAARATVELAMIDAYSRHFRRHICDAVGWVELDRFGADARLDFVRHSGVIATSDRSRMQRQLRLMWWYGLRDFKVKVGDDADEDRLRSVHDYLGRALRNKKASLRVDVNGAWDLETAISKLAGWQDVPIDCVEQPLGRGCETQLESLKEETGATIMHDESLCTMNDAEHLVALGVADAFNIRISKCGGLIPSLRLAQFARKHDVLIQLGCMVGETSILSGAARRFLEMVPGVRFVEGNFGGFLLKRDVVRRSLRFGFGGRVRRLAGFGWGVQVDASQLESLTVEKPIAITL